MREIIAFSIICACFLTALISYKFCFSHRDWRFLAVGMTFTLVSDFFLVLEKNQHIGFATFCFVHIAYILRVSRDLKKSLIFIFGIVVLSVPAFIFFDQLIASMILYGCLFIYDIIINIMNFKKGEDVFPKTNSILILTGIILFALCDVNVLIQELAKSISIPEWIANTSNSLIWIFYAPAQVILSVSAIKYRKN